MPPRPRAARPRRRRSSASSSLKRTAVSSTIFELALDHARAFVVGAAQFLDHVLVVAAQQLAHLFLGLLRRRAERAGDGEWLAADDEPGIAQRRVRFFPDRPAARSPGHFGPPAKLPLFCIGRAAASSFGARSMKPSITSASAARSFIRRWPHLPSRRISMPLTMPLDSVVKCDEVVDQRVRIEHRMARLAHRIAVSLDVAEDDLADQAHIGRTDQRVLRLARDHAAAA